MTEWKLHTLENDRIENVRHGKRQKNHIRKMQEKSQLENDRMENAHHGKWQKNQTLENARKLTSGN